MALSHRDSRGVITLTNDSQGEGYTYLGEVFIMDRSASEKR